jgi:hypothetical protein
LGDRRTAESKLLQRTREALIASIGGNPDAMQLNLIERGAQLHLRLYLMDRQSAT